MFQAEPLILPFRPVTEHACQRHGITATRTEPGIPVTLIAPSGLAGPVIPAIPPVQVPVQSGAAEAAEAQPHITIATGQQGSVIQCHMQHNM